MSPGFQFGQRLVFEPEHAGESLARIPALGGVFALRGERETDEPYLTRAADLRRRISRVLAPPDSQTKRLNLRNRVRLIEYTATGSEFESLLVLYDATAAIFGFVEARRRLRLNTPFCLRLTMEHAHPRVYSTNRLSKRGLARTYGPFPSRTAAERYCDAVLELFKLRRCYEDLEVHPDHPGCVYGEMKKCLAPCNTACTAEQYAAEASAVQQFFDTHGQSMLSAITAEREQASADMEFEAAAALHERYGKVKATAALADDLVHPLPQLRAILVQAAAPHEAGSETAEAAVFLLQAGCLTGPERLSTLGVRAAKEQTSVGSSLFAQPLMISAVPLTGPFVSEEENPGIPASRSTPSSPETPEGRAEHVFRKLEETATPCSDFLKMSDHLSLLRRWFYRPEKQRAGEIFFPRPDGSWPVRRILRGAARMVIGEPGVMAETQRDAVAAAKLRILHEGREGVERMVPVVSSRSRARRPKQSPSHSGTEEIAPNLKDSV